MSDPLATYLADHLAGSVHAIEVLKHLRDEYPDRELGKFAGELLEEVESDRLTLIGLAKSVGEGTSEPKELMAWFSERLSRIKLSHEGEASLGTFETLEHLALGIQGKWALWRVLDTVAPYDKRLRSLDYQNLSKRALDQLARLESWRLRLAHKALRATA